MKRIALGLFLLLPGVALGDGASFTPGSHGAGLVPINENRIQMVDEEVRVDASTAETFRYPYFSDDQVPYQVFCRFHLKNLKPEKVDILMGFPFETQQGAGEVQFKASLDGAGVQTVRQDSISGYSFAYTWKVSLGPLQDKNVYCFYRAYWSAMSGRGEEYSLSYITHTGGLWAGTIEKADFYIKLPEKSAPGLTVGKEGTKVGFSVYPADYVWDTKQHEIVFHRTNWKPKPRVENRRYYMGFPRESDDDLLLSYSRSVCDSLEEFFSLKEYEGDTRLYVPKDFDPPYTRDIGDREYSEGSTEWNSRRLRYLTLLRSEILARHGQTFSEPSLKSVFEKCAWYRPRGEAPTDVLKDTEKKNLQGIDEEMSGTQKNLKAITVGYADLLPVFRSAPYRGAEHLYQESDLIKYPDEGKNKIYTMLLKNEIFARHGHFFKTDLQKFFGSLPWYQPKRVVSFNELSDIEKKNVLFISDFANRKGWK